MQNNRRNAVVHSIFLPPLPTGVTFASLDAKDYIDHFFGDSVMFLSSNMRITAFWKFIIGFGIRSGATIEEVTTKVEAICSQYSNLLVRIPNVLNFFYDELQSFLSQLSGEDPSSLAPHYPSCTTYPITKEQIVLAFQKNPEFLCESGSDGLDYNFVSDEKLSTSKRRSRVILSKALQIQDANFCHQLLDIMEPRLGKKKIKSLLYTLNKENSIFSKPYELACYIGDDVRLYDRLESILRTRAVRFSTLANFFYEYGDQWERDHPSREEKENIIRHAASKNRIALLHHFQHKWPFVVEGFANKILLLDSTQYSSGVVIFLLDRWPDINSKIPTNLPPNSHHLPQFSLFESILLIQDPHFHKSSNFSKREIEIAIAFLERDVDLFVILERRPHFIQDLFTLFERTRKKHPEERGRIDYLQGLLAEKIGDSDMAILNYDIARKHRDFRGGKPSIQIKLKQLELFPERAAKLFDEIYTRYAEYRIQGIKREELLSPTEALHLISAVRWLPPRYAAKSNGTVDIRAKACQELWQYVKTVSPQSFTIADRLKWLWINDGWNPLDKKIHLSNLQLAYQLYKDCKQTGQQIEVGEFISYLMTKPIQMGEAKHEPGQSPIAEAIAFCRTYLSTLVLPEKEKATYQQTLTALLSLAQKKFDESAVIAQLNEIRRAFQAGEKEKPEMIKEIYALLKTIPLEGPVVASLRKENPTEVDIIDLCQQYLKPQQPFYSPDFKKILEETLQMLLPAKGRKQEAEEIRPLTAAPSTRRAYYVAPLVEEKKRDEKRQNMRNHHAFLGRKKPSLSSPADVVTDQKKKKNRCPSSP